MNKYQEALNYLIDNYCDIKYDGMPLNKDTALRLQELVDKVTPKKIYKGDWDYRCPTCNMPNVYDYEYDNKFRCCSDCGQRLDWGDIDG